MDPISEAIWPYFVSLFISIILISIYFDKKRRAKLESIAKDIGFQFSADGRSTTLSEHENFYLLKKGQNRQVSKELWGSLNGNDFRIFVYSYQENGGNNRWCHKTVLSIKCSRIDAPTLSFQPKLKRVMMIPDFGQYDSGIEFSPTLSRSYVIKGNDEVKVREFLNSAVINFFEANPDLYFEAQKDTLILCHSNRRSGYSDVEKLYAQGQELLSRLIE